MKQKRPEFLPASVHISWFNNGVFTKELLDEAKLKLSKIGITQFSPNPKDIFNNFSIDAEQVKMILVNDTYPLNVSKDTPYDEYPPILKEIWDKLGESEFWEQVELYSPPDLSDFLWCLKLNTNLTTNSIGVWDKFMHNLFSYYSDCSDDRYLFIFLTEGVFNKYSKYVAKKHEVQYLFNPENIREYFKSQWGITYNFGLPF